MRARHRQRIIARRQIGYRSGLTEFGIDFTRADEAIIFGAALCWGGDHAHVEVMIRLKAGPPSGDGAPALPAARSQPEGKPGGCDSAGAVDTIPRIAFEPSQTVGGELMETQTPWRRAGHGRRCCGFLPDVTRIRTSSGARRFILDNSDPRSMLANGSPASSLRRRTILLGPDLRLEQRHRAWHRS